MSSKFGPFWEAAMDKQVAALGAKGVLKKIPQSELSQGQKLLLTMWVGLKSDHLGQRARVPSDTGRQRG